MVQGHGVQMLVSALEEKLQRWKQQGLVLQQRAQLLHTLEAQGQLCEWEEKGVHRSAGMILLVSFHTFSYECVCLSVSVQNAHMGPRWFSVWYLFHSLHHLFIKSLQVSDIHLQRCYFNGCIGSRWMDIGLEFIFLNSQSSSFRPSKTEVNCIYSAVWCVCVCV